MTKPIKPNVTIPEAFAVNGQKADFLDEKEDMIALAARLYLALKDTPTEELQEKLISQLAFLAHEEAVKEHG